jgi:hypothetical protein
MPNAFHKLCRELGDMTRLIIKPAPASPRKDPDQQTTEVARHTIEKQLDNTTTLRRTTIDEIEVRHAPDRAAE